MCVGTDSIPMIIRKNGILKSMRFRGLPSEPNALAHSKKKIAVIVLKHCEITSFELTFQVQNRKELHLDCPLAFKGKPQTVILWPLIPSVSNSHCKMMFYIKSPCLNVMDSAHWVGNDLSYI